MQSNSTSSPWTSHLGAAAVTGLVAGTVVAIAIWALGMPTAAQPAWGSGESATSGARDDRELLQAIRQLTKVVQESELAPVFAPGPGNVRTPANDLDVGALTEALNALEQRIGRMIVSNSGSGGLSVSVTESARTAGIRTADVRLAIEALQADDSDAYKRTLLLRSADEMIERFGFPSYIYSQSAGFMAEWSLEGDDLHINFIDESSSTSTTERTEFERIFE